jgi:hypothetical protein
VLWNTKCSGEGVRLDLVLAGLLAVQTATIQTTQPPLSPEEAVRVLLAGRQTVSPPAPPSMPVVTVLRSVPGEGPFGPLLLRELPPTWAPFTYALPWPAFYPASPVIGPVFGSVGPHVSARPGGHPNRRMRR